MTNFEQVTEQIKAKTNEMKLDMALCLEKGNKSAGKRARQASLDLEKLMKQWRALSTGREPVTE